MPSPLEVFAILLGVMGAIALTHESGSRSRSGSRSEAWRWLYLPLTVLVLGAQWWFLGLYWPMLPADLVVLACAALLPFHRAAPARRTRLATVLVATTLCLGSLAAVLVLPFFRLPPPTGEYPVGTRTEHITDPATHRELVVQLWYPAAPVGRRARYMRLAETRPQFAYWHAIRTNAWQDAPVAARAGPLPLLLFGHMWGGRRTQDTFLAEDLASHGYLIAAIDHPGNSARIELADGSVLKSDRAKALANVEASTAPAIRALWSSELGLWTADNKFILDTLLNHTPSYLAGRIDNTRIGAFGHSFGGAASLALLGQAPQVKAALNMDGWTFDALDHRTSRSQPVLFLYAGPPVTVASTGPSVDNELDRQDLASVNQSLTRYGGCEAYIPQIQHNDFTDQTLVSPIQRLTYTGPLAGDRVRPLVRGLVLAFFDQTLRQQGQLANYPEVQTLCKP